jgi:hypothetical protein
MPGSVWLAAALSTVQVAEGACITPEVVGGLEVVGAGEVLVVLLVIHIAFEGQ